ncbi:hypothetical protein cyc_02477 [Cyclospora cayetanensis]|uniref:Uncharacterized protein n=1 Tax=Cyclospora cayetanensis TaxID=88456 RepID=A0A1D3D3Y5_9EIME|nr:hypothetical protein cyc_02477 [Cyclospora cayetanensis]
MLPPVTPATTALAATGAAHVAAPSACLLLEHPFWYWLIAATVMSSPYSPFIVLYLSLLEILRWGNLVGDAPKDPFDERVSSSPTEQPQRQEEASLSPWCLETSFIVPFDSCWVLPEFMPPGVAALQDEHLQRLLKGELLVEPQAAALLQQRSLFTAERIFAGQRTPKEQLQQENDEPSSKQQQSLASLLLLQRSYRRVVVSDGVGLGARSSPAGHAQLMGKQRKLRDASSSRNWCSTTDTSSGRFYISMAYGWVGGALLRRETALRCLKDANPFDTNRIAAPLTLTPQQLRIESGKRSSARLEPHPKSLLVFVEGKRASSGLFSVCTERLFRMEASAMAGGRGDQRQRSACTAALRMAGPARLHLNYDRRGYWIFSAREGTGQQLRLHGGSQGGRTAVKQQQ